MQEKELQYIYIFKKLFSIIHLQCLTLFLFHLTLKIKGAPMIQTVFVTLNIFIHALLEIAFA